MGATVKQIRSAIRLFPGLDELFKGRHFDREVIVLCVRWYLRGAGAHAGLSTQ
jgi:hypothetical protein